MLIMTLLGVIILAIIIVGIVSMTKRHPRDPALEQEERLNRRTPGNEKITPTG